MEKFILGNSYQNNPHLRSQKQPTKGKKKPIKIKYISSPMMVRANNALEFRAIVQELTGRDSNVTDLYDDSDHTTTISPSISWLSSSTHHHDELEADHHILQGSDDHDQVEQKFSNSAANLSFLAQINDDLGHLWRPEVSVESFNDFKSPCVFVGQN